MREDFDEVEVRCVAAVLRLVEAGTPGVPDRPEPDPLIPPVLVERRSTRPPS
ncbi:hypothetical protein [Dactylosporangium sp. NPDC051541]|uniref:hypothetical protein n=1 Tax=Dactylosporangium sp. NPDC051541 TaxID=3363977 RepID=UPI003788C21C